MNLHWHQCVKCAKLRYCKGKYCGESLLYPREASFKRICADCAVNSFFLNLLGKPTIHSQSDDFIALAEHFNTAIKRGTPPLKRYEP